MKDFVIFMLFLWLFVLVFTKVLNRISIKSCNIAPQKGFNSFIGFFPLSTA